MYFIYGWGSLENFPNVKNFTSLKLKTTSKKYTHERERATEI